MIRSKTENIIKEEIIISDDSDSSDVKQNNEPMIIEHLLNITKGTSMPRIKSILKPTFKVMKKQQKKILITNNNVAVNSSLLKIRNKTEWSGAKSILKPSVHVLAVNRKQLFITKNNLNEIKNVIHAPTMINSKKVLKEVKITCFLKCSSCGKREKILLTKMKVTCEECNELMKYECIKCHNLYPTCDTVYTHQLTSCFCKEDPNVFECKKCKIKIHKSIKYHEKFCGVELLLKCKFCDFEAKERFRLQEHMTANHIADIQKKATTYEGQQNSIKGYELFSSSKKTFKKSRKSYVLCCPKCGVQDVCLTSYGDMCPDCKVQKLFTCLICDKQCKSYQGIRYHANGCGTKETFYCDHCPFKTLRKKNLTDHIRRLHLTERQNKTRGYICNDCNTKFRSRIVFRQHRGICRSMVCLQCRFCPDKLQYRKELAMHLDKEHAIDIKNVDVSKLIDEIVEIAKKIKNDKFRILLKEDAHSVEKRAYRTRDLVIPYCLECDKTYSEIECMSQKCQTCDQVLHVQCLICKRIYRSAATAYYHLKTKCASSKYVQCTDCNLKIPLNKVGLNDPKCKHTFISPNSHSMCTCCGQKFAYQKEMKEHMQKYCTYARATLERWKRGNYTE